MEQTTRILRRLIVLWLVPLALAGVAVGAEERDGEMVVLVHPSNAVKSLSKVELRDIYLGARSVWSGGASIRVFTRGTECEVGRSFLRAVMKMTPARFRHHWHRLEFAGRTNTPEDVPSITTLLAKLADAPGGIGVAFRSELPDAPSQVRVMEIPE